MHSQQINEATLDQAQREWECGDKDLTWVEFKRRIPTTSAVFEGYDAEGLAWYSNVVLG